MEQRKLYKTLDSVASQKFNSEKDLLFRVVQKLVEDDQINVSGGRIWKLNKNEKAYQLIFQTSKNQKLQPNFTIKIQDYPAFDEVAKYRTVLSSETNLALQQKGIYNYSASGVGTRVLIDGTKYYQYIIALHSDDIKEDLRYILNIVATVLTSKLKERWLATTNKSIQEDIDKAKQLQRSILPEHEFTFHNYELFGITLPAETLGGDFFDYIQIGYDEERCGVVLGDAASKGISAAAEAMYISGALRMACSFQLKISPMMNMLNQLINKIFSDDRFTTLFYGELSNDKKGLFLYSNAGHNPPIFVHKNDGKIQMLDPTGPLLGPAPNSRFETDSINFEMGDVLVIYSDGITEAANESYELYEEDRLKDVIKKNIDLSPKQLTYTILDDIQKFCANGSKYQDDKSLVVIKRVR